MSNAETLHSALIYEHPYFTAYREGYRLSSGKIVDPYYFVEIPVSVTAMCITKEGDVIFIEQYRHPIGQILIELPGGFIDEGEDVHQALHRELMEETGYRFETVKYLTTTYGNPGALRGASHLFLATGGELIGVQELDENEEIQVSRCSLYEAREKLLRGEIKQSMHALCMFHAFQHLDNVI